MVTWQAFETEARELTSFGRERIDRRVSFLATVRGDGGPRVHPVTPWIVGGSLYVRMYVTSPKVADLERDPRFALHSMMDNDDGVGGDSRCAGGRRASTMPARSPPPTPRSASSRTGRSPCSSSGWTTS